MDGGPDPMMVMLDQAMRVVLLEAIRASVWIVLGYQALKHFVKSAERK